MKWFKHYCAEKDSEVMALIETEFGFEGLGRYWRIVEIVGSQMTSEKNWVEFPTGFWQNWLKVSSKKLRDYLSFLAEFSQLSIKFSEKSIRVGLDNYLELQDEWTKRKARDSGATPERLRPKEEEEEEEKEEEKEKENSTLPQPEVISAPAQAEDELCAEDAPAGRVRLAAAPAEPQGERGERAAAPPQPNGGARAQAERAAPPVQTGLSCADVTAPEKDENASGHSVRSSPPLEFIELRQVWDELARPEEPLAGLAEYRRLTASRLWPGLPRILDAARLLAAHDRQWQRGFAPGLARFLRLQGWLKPPDMREFPPASAVRSAQDAERENQKIIARMALAGMGVSPYGGTTNCNCTIDAVCHHPQA